MLNPSLSISLLSISITIPLSLRRSLQPSETSLRLISLAYRALPSRAASPFRWQQSFAASLLMKSGFHTGLKVYCSLTLLTQLNRVFTKLSSLFADINRSWISRLGVGVYSSAIFNSSQRYRRLRYPCRHPSMLHHPDNRRLIHRSVCRHGFLQKAHHCPMNP